jgi:hypothetical protein
LVGQLGGGQQKYALLDLAASVIQNQPGGLTDQLTSAFGQDNIEGMSQRLGVHRRRRSRLGWRRSCRTSSTRGDRSSFA